MSNSNPELCTKLRDKGRARYFQLLQHRSLVLAVEPDLPGRTGTTICGLRGAIDQERASHEAAQIDLLFKIRIHELPPCQRCQSF
jgi:hypothetical protein